MNNTKKPLFYAVILGFVGFVTSFGAHIVAVNLPAYAKDVGVGLAMIGLLIAAYDLAEIIAKPVFGTLADKQGMKKTMLAGILVFTLASLSYLLISPRYLLMVRFLQGLGAAALSAVSLALIGVYYAERRGQAYGVYNAIKGAGYVVSPIIGGAIVLKSSFSAIFIACALVGAVSFFVSLLLPNAKSKADDIFDDDDDFSLKGFISVFKEPKLLPWYVVTVVNMFFVGILFGFLPVRIYVLGYNPFLTGSLLSVVSLSYLLIQPVAGRLADRTDPQTTIRIGLFLAGVSIILAPFVKGIPLVIVSIMAGIGVGTVWTNTDALISALARQGRLGATMGVAGSFKEFGDMVGPLLIGLLSQVFGLTAGFVSCGVLGLLSLLLIARKVKLAEANGSGLVAS
ncbi:MAG: Tetracycline resistance protein, class B [Syntrophorhabdus sp. PtaU1.Bin153]|nr:MAG: Tetracycline resistance protein, class B [Syntrophorhabdus sp. PtaU1.Bin153]